MIELSSIEKRTAWGTALVFLLRDLGLMLVLPVFIVYARELPHSSPLLVGMALGAYGLSAAILQVPLCRLSHLVGRKLIVISGLIVFALGSYIASQMYSIEWLIVGRLLQGIGAIGIVLLAMSADLSRDVARLKITSIIGTAIGFSILLAIVLGAGLANVLGLAGLFILATIFAVIAVAITWFVIPGVKRRRHHRDLEMRYGDVRSVLFHPVLMRLNFGAFVLNFTLVATFVIAPLFIVDHLHIARNHAWTIYVPTLIVAFVMLFPAALLAERYRQLKRMVTLAIMLMIVAELLWFLAPSTYSTILVGLILFFTGFVVLQALLPAWLSKVVPLDKKGTAVSLYTMSQFLGAFIGGIAGGALIPGGGLQIYLVCLGLLVLWLLLAGNTFPPLHVTTRVYQLDKLKDNQHAEAVRKQYLGVVGVVDAAVIFEDRMAYVRVDAEIFETRESLGDALSGLSAQV
jgi:MFS family permease